MNIALHGLNYGSAVEIHHGETRNEFNLAPGVIRDFARCSQCEVYADFENKQPTAPEASFDSYVNQHKDQWLPGTRTDIID